MKDADLKPIPVEILEEKRLAGGSKARDRRRERKREVEWVAYGSTSGCVAEIDDAGGES